MLKPVVGHIIFLIWSTEAPHGLKWVPHSIRVISLDILVYHGSYENTQCIKAGSIKLTIIQKSSDQKIQKTRDSEGIKGLRAILSELGFV